MAFSCRDCCLRALATSFFDAIEKRSHKSLRSASRCRRTPCDAAPLGEEDAAFAKFGFLSSDFTEMGAVMASAWDVI